MIVFFDNFLINENDAVMAGIRKELLDKIYEIREKIYDAVGPISCK